MFEEIHQLVAKNDATTYVVKLHPRTGHVDPEEE
jgi:hypothetical protein